MEKNSALRIGVAGCGQIANGVHIPALLRIPGVVVSAVVDPDERSRQAALRLVPKAAAFSDTAQLFAADPIDAMLICAPNALHAPIAIQALERGIHIYLEKPLATSLADGLAVLHAWRKSARVGMIGFNYRFNRLYDSVRQCIQSGRLGEIVAVRSVFSLASHEVPSWKRDIENGGGVLFDLASHHIDLARHLFGTEVRSVLAQPTDRCESATVEMRLENGIVMQSFFSLAAVEDDHIEVYGRKGKVKADRHLSLDVQLRGATNRSARAEQLNNAWRTIRRTPYLWEKRRAPAFEPSYSRALDAFVSAIRAGKLASPDLLDGYRSLAAIQAMIESAASGRWIDVHVDADSAAQ